MHARQDDLHECRDRLAAIKMGARGNPTLREFRPFP
jgi:hypothetical protein